VTIASVAPQRIEDLKGVKGVGPAFLERHAPSLVELFLARS
jgi:DNA uptake protein ComE-like DNA-binding protein